MYESELRTLLIAATGLSSRMVNWDSVAIDVGFPSVSMHDVSNRIQHTMEERLENPLVQVDVWALDKSTAINLRDKIKGQLDMFKDGTDINACLLENVRSSFEKLSEEQVAYRYSMDFRIFPHQPFAPINVEIPTISGYGEGNILTATPGSWESYPREIITFFQWFADGEQLLTETESTLEITPDLIGKLVHVEVRAENVQGDSAWVASEKTVPIIEYGPPSLDTIPEISGTVIINETLIASSGTWTANPAVSEYTYQWYTKDESEVVAPISGETSASLTITSAYIGKSLGVEVTATNTQGSTSAMSEWTTEVLPLMTVTGGTITTFNREGVDYTQVLFTQSGGYSVSGDVASHNFALAAGGGNGGHGSAGWVPGGGGAGGLIETLDAPLTAGDYTVSIGAGAPPTTTVAGEANGSDSVLNTPSQIITAIGGGFGASTTVGHTAGSNGGSGGGGRGGTSSTTVVDGGTGTANQGSSGGLGSKVDDSTTRASAGGGGAGGPGGAASAGVAGTRGPGKLLDWIATPRTVCQGGSGLIGTFETSSPDAEWGSGADPAYSITSATGGAGGDGFLFIVVRSNEVTVQ